MDRHRQGVLKIPLQCRRFQDFPQLHIKLDNIEAFGSAERIPAAD
jgi:hypothetical protein